MKQLAPLMSLEPKQAASAFVQISHAALSLTKLRDIGQYYKETELQRELSSLVFDVCSAQKSQADRVKLLQQRLSKYLVELRSRIGYWRIVVPVDNLTMPGRRRVRVGDVEFRGFTQIRAQKALAQIKGFLSRNPVYAKNRKFIEQYIDERRKHDIGTLVGSICAETEVYGKADDAFSDALPKIEEAVACLKLFHYWNDDFYGRYFGILGKVPRRVWRPMLIYPRGTGFIGNECAWIGPLLSSRTRRTWLSSLAALQTP